MMRIPLQPLAAAVLRVVLAATANAVARWPGRINPDKIDEFINNYESYKLDDNCGDF